MTPETPKIIKRRQYRWLLEDIDEVITHYACDQYNTTKIKAENCRCGSCKGRHEDAADRMLFIYSLYRWHLGREENGLPSINNGDSDLAKT